MHVEPTPAHVPPEEPLPTPKDPTAGEWAIGIVFVLAALGLVAWIAWTISRL